jgi:hypothetical protein
MIQGDELTIDTKNGDLLVSDQRRPVRCWNKAKAKKRERA